MVTFLNQLMSEFIYLYLLSNYYVPGPVLGHIYTMCLWKVQKIHSKMEGEIEK